MNMKTKKFKLLDLISTWPSGFSILEFLILLIGIGSGTFIYFRMDQIRTDSINARAFERETSEILLSVSLAHINFNDLMSGSSEDDINQDVYAHLNNAENFCEDIDKGGTSGKFVPVQLDPQKAATQPLSVCTLLADFRSILELRWQDHIEGNPDSKDLAYETSFDQILQSLQRFEDVADPHIEEADLLTKQSNLELSISLTFVFLVIVFVIWRTRRMMLGQTKQLEKQVKVSSQLNIDLDNERNLLNTLLDAIPDAVFAKDKNNRFLIANPAAAHVMGKKNKDDLVGKSEADFQSTDVSSRILANDAEILETGESRLNEQELITDIESGKPRWRQTTKVALRNRTGEITGLVGISRDITQQKETEEALKNSNEKLTSGIAALEQSNRETEHLSEMVDLLQACPSTEEACVVIADQLARFFPEDSGVLYLYHASRNILDRASSWGPPLADPVVFKPDDCWGLRRGRMHIVETFTDETTETEGSKPLICPHVNAEGPADYLCVPLVAQGEALGLLHLRHKDRISRSNKIEKDTEWYTHTKRQRIHTIIDSLSLSLANLKLRSTLKQQSIRDPLTGMYNRRYMEETLEREVLRAARNNESVGVIMLDIDHFKRFNDTFGHQAGDILLQSLGHLFLTHIRGEDVPCRYGGEEFILLLPGSSLEKTRLRAEELREKVHFMNVTFQGQSLGTISLSFGVSVFPDHGSTPDALVQAADQALYRAKTEGRDRVVLAS